MSLISRSLAFVVLLAHVERYRCDIGVDSDQLFCVTQVSLSDVFKRSSIVLQESGFAGSTLIGVIAGIFCIVIIVLSLRLYRGCVMFFGSLDFFVIVVRGGGRDEVFVKLK